MAPHKPRLARDAAHALERRGVAGGPDRVQKSARAAERDSASGVVQLGHGAVAAREEATTGAEEASNEPTETSFGDRLALALNPLYRDLFDRAKVKLPGPEQRKPIHSDKAVEPRDEEIRQSSSGQLLHDGRQRGLVERVQHGQPLALALVRHARDCENLRAGACGLVQGFLDATMWDHLTPDLREPRQAIDDADEPVVI